MKRIPLLILLGLTGGVAAAVAATPVARVGEITIDDYSDIVGSQRSRDAAAKAEAVAAEQAATQPRVRRAIAIPGGIMQPTEFGAAQFMSARGSEILTIDNEGRLRLPDNVYSPDQLSNIPTAKLQIKPAYPMELRRQGVGGKVTVNFIVDRDGNVSAAWASRSTQPAFERSAVDAVVRWRFLPGKIRGAAVDTVMVVDIVFNLNDAR